MNKHNSDHSDPNAPVETESTSPPPEDRLVSAQELLRILWTEDSRPSLRWLRAQQQNRTITYTKVGARVWFRPSQVRRELEESWTIKRATER